MPVFTSRLRNLTGKTIIIICIVYVIATYILVEKYILQKKNVKPQPVMQLDYVVVHLDFKGAPPKLSYLTSILPMLKSHGVNGLLIEYEDMFPYQGKLKKLAAANCYKKNELRAFLKTAVALNFEVIPLVQTFGHMEFALKHKAFAHLREIPGYADTICPSSTESQDLLQNMLKQVIDFHERISPLKYFHVGCDEVTHLNNCSLCQARNFSNAETYSLHLRFIINTVHELSPDTTVLIWNDIDGDVKLLHSINSQFPSTDAVYWGGIPNLHSNVYRSNQMFDSLWIATAFKGADGRSQILPNLRSRFLDNLFWLEFIIDYNTMRNMYKIKGIILTGRSRYSHAAPLCELLPASIHSLIFNLIVIDNYRNGIFVDTDNVKEFIDEHVRRNFTASLYCPRNMSNILQQFDARSCHYLESNLFVVLQNISAIGPLVHSILGDNLHRYYSSSTGVTVKSVDYTLIHGRPQVQVCTQLFRELMVLEGQLTSLLSVYYEEKVVKEYVGITVRRLMKTIANLLELWSDKQMVKEKIIG